MAEVIQKKSDIKKDPDLASLTIDGREITVPKGTTVLQAALQLGIHIPTFCWHPKLKSVGACRMCYVEIEKFPKLQVSCATPVMDGMVVHTDTDQVKQGRRAVIEFLLTNHPLDCPTCDKGGECDLQDLTFAHGFDDSRFAFQKQRWREDDVKTTFDDVRIGPEIVLNRNRCILCFRCVRANKEAFGEYDLGAYERGAHTEINAAPGQQVDNPFSGNLVEICPVGALTNTDWRYRIRVWLTKTTASIDTYYSSGSNILFYKEDHKNTIFRVTSRRNDNVDDGWLPDVTRYGYQIANSPERLQSPLIKKDGKQTPAGWDEALDVIVQRFNAIRGKKGSVCIGGLASPSLDNASLYSFAAFFRNVFRSNNIDFRCDYPMLPERPDSLFSVLCNRPFRIADIDSSDVIITFGSDLIREHPNEYLRVRKACMFGSPKIYSMNPYAVRSADVTDLELVYRPGTDETLINGICLAAVEEQLVDYPDADRLAQMVTPATAAEAARQCGVSRDDLKIIAQSLADGKKVSFLMGELIARSLGRESIAAAVANLNLLFGIEQKGQLAVLARYANSRGAAMLGLMPSLPAAQTKKLRSLRHQHPDCQPHTTDQMLLLMKKEELRGFMVLGANPVMLYPDRDFVRAALEKLEFLVVCDLFETETTELADVVLPLSSWAEYAGEYVNLEGRLQHADQAIKPIGSSRPGFEIINAMRRKFDEPMGWSPDQAAAEIKQLLELESDMLLPGELCEVKTPADEENDEYPIPLFVVDNQHHSGHLTEKATSLANFAGEPYVEMSPELAAQIGATDGQPVRVESEVGKVIVAAKVSELLDTDVVLLPRNFSAAPVNSLLMRKRRVNRVKLTAVSE